MKNFKNKILDINFKKYTPIIIVLVLFVSTLVLALVDFSSIKMGQAKECDGCQERENIETEYISQDMTCSRCDCSQAGKKMFSFYGTEADCEDMKKEKDRYDCYAKHSLREQTCGHIVDNNLKIQCMERFSSMIYKYYLGPGGTLVNQNNVTIKGDTTILNGFDQYGEHKLMTGTEEARDLAITFRRRSGDVEFNNNLFVPGDLRINSTYGGVYFGSELVFDDVIYENGDLSSWKTPPRFPEASAPSDLTPVVPDRDEDDVNDRDDNCRDTPNPGQQDYDGDEIGDICDPNPFGLPPSPLDSDGDSIPYAYDNCPTISNISQLDSDGDGMGDACDPTPGGLGDVDGDGVTVASGDCNDSDSNIYPGAYDIPNDGIDQDCDGVDAITLPPADLDDIDGDDYPNINDNCPDDYNPGQADNDGDGFGNDCDNCPNISNPGQEDADGDGTGDICESAASCGGVVYERELYGGIQIGSQCWMDRNLNVGIIVPEGDEQTFNGVFEKYCANGMEVFCSVYGGLYQWQETRENRGICPSGWHVPTDHEIWVLENHYATENCAQNTDGFRCYPALTALTGYSGFGFQLSGYRDANPPPGEIRETGNTGAIWSSTRIGSEAYLRAGYKGGSETIRSLDNQLHGNGVRCIHD